MALCPFAPADRSCPIPHPPAAQHLWLASWDGWDALQMHGLQGLGSVHAEVGGARKYLRSGGGTARAGGAGAQLVCGHGAVY